MPISLQNSKRCLIAKISSLSAALALAAALIPATTLAAKAPALAEVIRSDIRNRDALSFESLFNRWQIKYGSKAIAPLLHLASDQKRVPDPDRFVALMGVAKLGGKSAGILISPYLKDTSWMLRSGALRALRALDVQDASIKNAALSLLKDPALVVRSEAVDTVVRLKPAQAKTALLDTLQDPENYHAGKAQWVPQKALKALVELKALDAAPKLKPLLAKQSDPALQTATVSALESLTGKRLGESLSLAARVQLWQQELSKTN